MFLRLLACLYIDIRPKNAFLVPVSSGDCINRSDGGAIEQLSEQATELSEHMIQSSTRVYHQV